LAVLPPALRRWFADRFGRPTAAQCHAWPAIAAGHHLLLAAPTGSGKSLAAFLPLLGDLLTTPPDGLRCLYVAPLKALATDARRNLRRVLAELARIEPSDAPLPRIALRTGDTSPRLRRRLQRRPPAILLTTPESLAVLLANAGGPALFAALRWVIVDEVHALAESKRGADLALSLERIDDLARQPQRIGLSATCRPLGEVAQFLVGVGRACTVAQVADAAPLEVATEPLPEDGRGFLARVVDRLSPELERHPTTLVFTNARGLAERLTWALRQRFPAWEDRIAAHHGSLSALRRRHIERQLKSGRLRVVVSSTSLELGIDIGSLENVVLARPAGGAARLLQRLGRSGHGPHRTRRGLVLTSSPAELLQAAVTAAAAQAGQLEPVHCAEQPLDVLCQHLAGMAIPRPWTADEAFALVRRARPYRDLVRADFDACLAYLAGRHRDGSDWLPPRLRFEDGQFSIADARTAHIVRRNLGTIQADEPRPVRLTDGSPIGCVDEPYAERLQPGDRFLLDGRCLEFKGSTWAAVEVEEVVGQPLVPRWSGEGWSLSAEVAAQVHALRVRAGETLRDGPAALAALLADDFGLTGDACRALTAYFDEQDAVSEIPGAATCLIEVVAWDGAAEYYLHTPLHRAGNDALARVLTTRLLRNHGRSASSLVADLGLLLCVPGPVLSADCWRELLAAEGFEGDLEIALAEAPAVRERFRPVAFTALMLLRNPLGRRRKVGGQDWADRCLFEQVRAADPEFVLLRQAAREVRSEVCDVAAALAFVRALPQWALRLRTVAGPSPFARHWSDVTAGPAESPESPEDVLRRLHAQLTGSPGCGFSRTGS
jgi:ATP-dependent Lhr-like helicase